MNKDVLSISAFAWLLVACMASCKKEPLPVLPTPVTKLDMITYSSWQLKAQGFDTDFNGTIDIDETPPFDCFLDNQTFFYKDSTGDFDQGIIKCDTSHPQSRRFQWHFINDTTIRVDEQNYNIIALTAKEFIVWYEDVFTPAPNRYIMEMRH